MGHQLAAGAAAVDVRLVADSRRTPCMQVLVVSPPEHGLPEGTPELLRDIGWEITSTRDYGTAIEAAGSGSIDAVIVSAPPDRHTPASPDNQFDALLGIIDARRIGGVVVADGPRGQLRSAPSLVDTVDRGISPAELRGRLAMIDRYRSLVRRLEGELSNVQRLGNRLNEHFREIDREMRLAGRLQRDFLPDIEDPMGNIRFAAVYRPASWVSGDIFDVFPIDENTTGFYVADAVGHGLAAGLLTMFIKRAVISTRINGENHTVMTPSQTMDSLNNALTDQALPNCQFVTACYGTINHETLTLQHARAGHPYPILITADGAVCDLQTPGGLLGIFKGAQYPTLETQLHPGDKLILYTDGIELALSPHAARPVQDALRTAAALPIRELTARLESQLDAQTHSSQPADDVTVVGLEVLRV